MSQLTPFVRAFGALSKSFDDQAVQHRKEAVEQTAFPADSRLSEELAAHCDSFAAVFNGAAVDLRQQIADDLARGPGRQVYHIPTKAEAEDLGPRPAGISPE